MKDIALLQKRQGKEQLLRVNPYRFDVESDVFAKLFEHFAKVEAGMNKGEGSIKFDWTTSSSRICRTNLKDSKTKHK